MADQLGDRIRKARERRRWTQQELADLVGVSRETVGNWETGQTSPRNRMQRLIEVLGSDFDPGFVQGAGNAPGVMLSLPDEVLEGLSAAERDEVLTAARLRALEKAREIRGT